MKGKGIFRLRKSKISTKALSWCLHEGSSGKRIFPNGLINSTRTTRRKELKKEKEKVVQFSVWGFFFAKSLWTWPKFLHSPFEYEWDKKEKVLFIFRCLSFLHSDWWELSFSLLTCRRLNDIFCVFGILTLFPVHSSWIIGDSLSTTTSTLVRFTKTKKKECVVCSSDLIKTLPEKKQIQVK